MDMVYSYVTLMTTSTRALGTSLLFNLDIYIYFIPYTMHISIYIYLYYYYGGIGALENVQPLDQEYKVLASEEEKKKKKKRKKGKYSGS